MSGDVGVTVGRLRRLWARCWLVFFGVLVGVPPGVRPRSDPVHKLIDLQCLGGFMFSIDEVSRILQQKSVLKQQCLCQCAVVSLEVRAV
jgi:hypothetical protein